MRKKSKNILYKIILLVLVVLVIVLIFLAQARFLTIRQVAVNSQDVKCASSDEIRNASKLIGQHFLLVNSAQVSKNLQKKFMCVKSAAVDKSLPNKVNLQVWGRQPKVVLISIQDKTATASALIENIATPAAKDTQDRYLVDDESIVFTQGTDEALPKIYLYNLKIALGEKLTNIADGLKILDKIKTLGISIRESLSINDLLIVVPEATKPKMIFRLGSNVDMQLASLQLILAEAKINRRTISLEFIDLRFDKPVIKVIPKKGKD